ncbi:beta-galactosidase trimerization domain-containing protein [Candidatus Omnitrophota bacterium]
MYFQLRYRHKLISFFLLAGVLLVFSCSSPKNMTDSIKHAFTINKTADDAGIDGILNEPHWKDSNTLGDFRIDADPERIPDVTTGVSAAYNDKALLVAFTCEETMAESSAKTGNRKKDYCELQVFSRPETPYYSPFIQRLDYKNASDSMRTQRFFIVTATGDRRDGNIYKTGPHTPYITDDSWEGDWESSVSADKDGYTVEMSIPWDTIGGMPQPGHTFKLQFVRHRNVPEQEILSFNWCAGENIQVESFDPKDFTQEHAQIFSPVVFEDNHALLTRYVETEDPWEVKRPQTEYMNALTNRPVDNRAAHFYLGIRGFLLPGRIREKYDDATWAAEENNYITEMGKAGINGPFLPGFMSRVGESGIDSLYDEHGMKFSYHVYGSTKKAMDAGAKILRPRGTPAFFDPVYVGIKNDILAAWLKKYGDKPWLFDIRGQDEPFNQIGTILQPGTYEMVNADLKRDYGVELGVPVGIPNIPYQNQPIHDRSRRVPDHETALSRIAVFRWLNRKFHEVAKSEYDIAKKYAPDKLYQAYNRNAVADMDFLDQSLIYDVTDYFSADPYPSFCIYVYGAARSRYHVGFTSKWVTDLAVGKPTQMIIQGCDMIQRYSTPENVREWTSQAAKTGATILDWWGNPRLDHPDLYREMLRLSRLWIDLPAPDVPEHAEIAVLFSDDSRVAAGDEALHAHYTLQAILGEDIGAWFTFVSENHVRRGLQSLEGYKLIIAPQLAYVSQEFADLLIKQVEGGATLVLLDPDALKHDIESDSLANRRKALLGMENCTARNASEFVPTDITKARFPCIRSLPLRPLRNVGNTDNARVLDVPSDADVLFSYSDGSPGAYSRNIGDGRVIVFGAMPFQDSEFAIKNTGWNCFFSSIIDELKIESNLPVWKFMFPKEGGEAETFDLLVPSLND